VIGRQHQAQICLPVEDISRRHLSIRRSAAGRYVLEDLGSRNGTSVNGVPVKNHVLEFGDKIRVGAKTLLMFTPYSQLEDQLLQSQKMESIGQLAGGIAHDFNNILAALLANISFMRGVDQRTTFGATDVRDCLGEMEAAALRAAELTQQLLGFARRTTHEERPVQISKLLDEAAVLVSRTFPSAVELYLDADPGLTVGGDATQLHQVVINLLINARDAMPAGGRITVNASGVTVSDAEVVRLPFLLPGAYALVAVKDTGTGMDEATRRRVFEPFFTTKPQGKGTGMGLATAYGIVKNHGGHVDVESRPGAGSTFKVYLPLRTAAATTTTAEPALVSAEDSSTRNIARGLILVVDDEEIVRQSARRLLEAMGYGVLVAADGVKATEVFEQHHDMIELVLLDMVMPNLGGAETFHKLRAIKPAIKVLLSSGHAEQASVRALIAAGAVGFLPKPYDSTAIGAAIKAALRRSRESPAVAR
jgi:signal transduction histidine kinase/CheY-like chemotaxis protein